MRSSVAGSLRLFGAVATMLTAVSVAVLTALPAHDLHQPKGCWDWWGYLGSADGGYATRSGPQMVTVMSMVGALGG